MRDHHALAAFLTERVALPYGGFQDFDCCVRFADAAVAAQTGRHPLEALGHTWSSKIGAGRLLARLGGLEPAVSLLLPTIGFGSAMRGDIALVPSAPAGVAGMGLMIVEGDTLAGPHAHGVRRLPRSAMVAAWSAGG